MSPPIIFSAPEGSQGYHGLPKLKLSTIFFKCHQFFKKVSFVVIDGQNAFVLFVYFYVMLSGEPSFSHMLDKPSALELQPQPMPSAFMGTNFCLFSLVFILLNTVFNPRIIQICSTCTQCHKNKVPFQVSNQMSFNCLIFRNQYESLLTENSDFCFSSYLTLLASLHF